MFYFGSYILPCFIAQMSLLAAMW